MRKEAQILSDAELLIADYGHIKNEAGNKDDGFCIYGAVCLAGYSLESNYVYSPLSNECLQILYSTIGNNISEWNDRPETTSDDVRQTLLAAASLAMDGAA